MRTNADACADFWPVLFVLALLAWSYYAYVFEFCVFTLKTTLELILYLSIYHVFLVMMLWCYFRVIWTSIAIVPEDFKISHTLFERIKETESNKDKNVLLVNFCQQKQITVITRTKEGHIRFCNKCKLIKPDRGHHCSKCQCCVLKMDHHCPWVNNCVNFSNYKYFTLFLIYANLYCVLIAATTGKRVINYWIAGKLYELTNLQITLVSTISCFFEFILLCFLCYNISLISKNQTSLESMRATTFENPKITFNMGIVQNFAQVFGHCSCLWFFPVWTSLGDGVDFPTRLTYQDVDDDEEDVPDEELEDMDEFDVSEDLEPGYVFWMYTGQNLLFLLFVYVCLYFYLYIFLIFFAVLTFLLMCMWYAFYWILYGVYYVLHFLFKTIARLLFQN